MPRVDAKNYQNRLGWKNKLYRLLWAIASLLFFKPSPTPLFVWRRILLRLFGAKIGRGVHIYPSCSIWAPYNLTMDDYSCLSRNVDCYAVAPVHIGANATVSQRAFLCTATHDISQPLMPLVTRPIIIGSSAWVAAEAFIGPGVTVSEGAVVCARAVVTKSVESWTVVAGNPARHIKTRQIVDAS